MALNNPGLYDAALAAIAGSNNAWLIKTTISDYDTQVTNAKLLATEIDALIPQILNISNSQINLLTQIVSHVMQGRTAINVSSATNEQIATAIAAMFTDYALQLHDIGTDINLFIQTASLADADAGIAYSQTIDALSGSPPYSFRIIGNLPLGLSLNQNGTISGTPLTAGSYTFTVVVNDIINNTATKTYTITVWNFSSKIHTLFGNSVIQYLQENDFYGSVSAADSSPAGTSTGAYTAVTLGTNGLVSGEYAAGYSIPANSTLNDMSAALAAVFNGDEFTRMQWFKPNAGFWTSGASEMFFNFWNVGFTKYCQAYHSANNVINIQFPDNSRPVNIPGNTSEDWTHLIYSVSKTANRQDAYRNGILVYQDVLGANWAGTLNTSNTGNSKDRTNPFNGLMAHDITLNRRISLWEGLLAGEIQSSGVWNPIEAIIEPSSVAKDSGFKGEPNLFYDNNPQILINASHVFKLIFSQGDDTSLATTALGYAESVDFINWTEYNNSTPILVGYTRASGPCIFGYDQDLPIYKLNGFYYMTAMRPNGGDHVLDLLKSTDGINWIVAVPSIITADTTETNINNSCLIYVNNTWYVSYDYVTVGGPGLDYRIGIASSPNALTTPFTKSPFNPIIIGPGTNAARTASGPFMYFSQTKNKWYIEAQCNESATVPTDIYRFESLDPLNGWLDSITNPLAPSFRRHNPGNGWFYQYGQVADVSMVYIPKDGKTYMVYASLYTESYQTQIEGAISSLSIDQITDTREGIPLSYSPQMIKNNSFETPDRSPLNATFSAWVDAANGGAIARVTNPVHSGSSRTIACKLLAGPAKTTNVSQQIINLVPNKVYTLTAWICGDGGLKGGRLRVQDSLGTDLINFGSVVGPTSASYQCVPVKFTAPMDGIVTVFCYCPDAVGSIAYFDDITLSY